MREIKFRMYDKLYGLCVIDFYTFEEMGIRNIKDAEDMGYIIEQYTGLKDKNGKEIYEGDIVYLAGYGDLVVEDFGFDLWDSVKSGHSDDIGEIIGNIHEGNYAQC